MTQAATEFVGPLTFAALSGHPVQTQAFDGTMQHLALTRDCDLLIVAPATANILAKAANGIADDLVRRLCRARTRVRRACVRRFGRRPHD